jgi:cytochrome b561
MAASVGPEPPQWYLIVRWVAVGGLVLIVVFRLLLEGTVSKPPPGMPPKWDRLLVDPYWTPIHFLTGITLGVWLVPLVVVAIATMAWEVLEISVPGFGDEEITGNRLIDILVAWIGWLIAALIIGHLAGVSLPLV